MGGPLGTSLDGLVEDFNAADPGGPVESVSMGRYTALSQKIMAAVAAGGPPDIAQCYEAWTGNLIDNGSVASLTEMIQGPDGLSPESLADIYPIFLEGGTRGGEIWSFPFNKSVRMLYYNRDRFAEAGLDPDAPPRTWEEYRLAARALTRDLDGDGEPDQYGTASQITVTIFENLLVQAGGTLLDSTETKSAFDSPEGLKALRFMADLLVNDGSCLLSQGFEYQNEFLAGNVAMIEGSSVSLAFMRGKIGFDMGIASLPAGEFDTQLVAGTDVVVFRTDPSRERAAWEFIRWFTDTERTARWSAETGYIPVRRSAMEHPVMQEHLAQYSGLAEAYAQLERALPQPSAKGWYAGRKILESVAIEPVLRGIADPEEALALAAAKADAQLSGS
jgi:multiple sugar transport system substrate-binding protein